MYEFSNREIRTKFKGTEYGKKINKMLYISIIVSFILFIASCILFFLKGMHNDDLIVKLWLNIVFGVTVISIIISCYFDGKRDGAIEQFKKGIEKK